MKEILILITLVLTATSCATPTTTTPPPPDRAKSGNTAQVTASPSPSVTLGNMPKPLGPFTFKCNDGSEIIATFVQGDAPTAELKRGAKQWTLPLAPSGSGARYANEKVTFWNKGRGATFESGDDGLKLDCQTDA